MARLLLRADAILRGRTSSDTVALENQVGNLVICCLAFGAFYGAVMGSFGGFDNQRLLQILFSASKVPLLLMVTFLISLPSFFVLNTLFGLRNDFTKVLAAILTAQAATAIVLASLAPYTALWYASSGEYRSAPLFNGIMFAIASFTGQGVLRRRYQPLMEGEPRHRALFWLWLVIYVFVGMQMAWTLRPFVGDPGLPVEFFREETWGNAYLKIYEAIAKWLARM